ncbi:hypothetical protein Mapa_008106 [Marchantia paleacea]|nr:hypothetical protein Mapa_008106 [Marchantia paleacea]
MGYLSLAYCIAYFRQRVSIALQRALAGAIHRRAITLGDASSDAPIVCRPFDLDSSYILGAVGNISHCDTIGA